MTDEQYPYEDDPAQRKPERVDPIIAGNEYHARQRAAEEAAKASREGGVATDDAITRRADEFAEWWLSTGAEVAAHDLYVAYLRS